MDPVLHRDAEARGLTRDVLRGALFTRPARGVSMLRAHEDDLASRCRAVALVLPDDVVFTHLTAATLRGWWLPAVRAPLLIACTDADAPHHDRRGVYVRRCGIPTQHRERLGDVPVASAAWTIIELAEHLRLIDLVVAIDGALHLGHVSVPEIRDAMVPGRRGVRVLRRALDLVEERSESAWESVLRLLHVLAGVPVESQAIVTNPLGHVVARGDLRIRGTRRLVEYDGADHRDRDQHRSDLRREKELSRLGFERFGYVAPEIMSDPGQVIRDADTALGRRHDPSRLFAWEQEIAASSFTGRGASALEHRLGRFVRSTTPRRREPDRPHPSERRGVDETCT